MILLTINEIKDKIFQYELLSHYSKDEMLKNQYKEQLEKYEAELIRRINNDENKN